MAQELREYKGFSYGVDNHNRWFFVFPSGLQGYPHVTSEAELLAALDQLIEHGESIQ